MSDELTGIFDDLDPEDFKTETSAVGICDVASLTGTFAGPEGFRAFVNRNIETVRTSFKAAEGDINPIAILANPVTQYVFVPEDDERLEDFSTRLRRECVGLKITWSFVCQPTQVGSAMATPNEAGELPEPDDQEQIEKAMAENRLQTGVWFTCQRREGSERDQEVGYMLADKDNVLANPFFSTRQRASAFTLW